MTEPLYRPDLALVHHRGFGFHAERCADGVLALLEPVRGGVVLEFGCGSGLLTRRLIDAGHRVIGTDASPAMLKVARTYLGAEADLRRLTLPDDELPPVDAIVGIGHPISYLPDAEAIDRALQAFAAALRPGGVLAFDVCDRSYGAGLAGRVGSGRAGEDWALIIDYETPAPDTFVRNHTSFVANGDGTWRRDTERHATTLVDTSQLPERLAELGVRAQVRTAFGQERLEPGLQVIAGTRA